ncbi:MAG: HD domain-containing protein [Acidobacteria bacterium]|nr:HD domain-containing protein [Acidobacteriota bacterium]MBV9477848.1 HD domain-containing protein [Acidobacteriota bacterium]
MHPDVEEVRPKLKEILYDCAVEIRATKAALYLSTAASRYELVTEYGFRGNLRTLTDDTDPVVDRCGRGRTPFYVNGVGAEPRFSQRLFEASTDRLLVAPLYSRGKLVGLIDMRDKAGKAPFEEADVLKAQSIADRIVALFAKSNLFGHHYIALSRASGEHLAVSSDRADDGPDRPLVSATPPVREKPRVAPAPPPQQQAPPPAAAPELAPPRAIGNSAFDANRLAILVRSAHEAASRIGTADAEAIGETEVSAARDVLRSILLVPGAIAAVFSTFGHLGGVQEIAARTALTDDAQRLIQEKLNAWLAKRGEAGAFVRTNINAPFGTSAAPITAADIQKVVTAPLSSPVPRGLYLTVVFAAKPERATHDLLAVLHAHLQLVLEQSLQRGAAGSLRARIAEKLVEPDFAKLPALRRHSDLVSRLTESFARYIGLPAADVENARLAALVHDCGMRLLDYERLYRKRQLTHEDLAMLREHATVGAALVEPLLGPDVARVVLAHHERVDGRGYPHELRGDDIPLAARLLQIADAWVTMIDPESYHAPEPFSNAIASVARGAGSQFDAELAQKFIELIRSGSARPAAPKA